MSNLVNQGEVQVQALINAVNQNNLNSQEDAAVADAETAAINRKIEQQVAIKAQQLKSGISEHESFSSDQNVNFQKALRGGLGADAQRWAANPELQNKLTVAQKRLFLASFGDSAAQASTVAGAMNRLAEVQNFTQAVPTTQAMGDLHAAVQNNPKIEEPAKQMLQSSFMQAPKADTSTKVDFMRFGLQQISKGGDLNAVKAAGDMLGVLAKNVPGRAQQRAMGMVRRDPDNTSGMKTVDKFVQGPPVQKLPLAARGTATEALTKANGSADVADGLNKVAEALTSGQVPPDAEGMPPKPAPGAKKMSREMKARLFATIATGRPSELRGITDKTLLALQSNNFPTRQSQVKSFMSALQAKVASGDAKDIDPDQLVRRSKNGPLPKVPALQSTAGLDDDDARVVRAQNRAVVMKYYNQVNRSYAGVNDKLQGGEYLEDVRTLPNLREATKLDTSQLSEQDKADIEPLLKLKGNQAQSTYNKLKVSQQKRMRELRGKRMPKAERMKKAAERRSVGVQPKYFNVSSLRGARVAPNLPVPSQSAGAGNSVRQAPPLGGRAQDTAQMRNNGPSLPVPQRGLSESQNSRGMASAPTPQRSNMGGAQSNMGGAQNSARLTPMQSSMGGTDPAQAMAARIANFVDKSAPVEVQMQQMTQAMAAVMQEQMMNMQAQFTQAMSAMMTQNAPAMPEMDMKAPVAGRPMSPQAPELPMNEPQERSTMQAHSAPQQRRNVGGQAEFLRAPPLPQEQVQSRGPQSLGAVEAVGQQRSQGFGAAMGEAQQQLQGDSGHEEVQARGFMPQQSGVTQQHDPRVQAQNPQQGFSGQPQQPGLPPQQPNMGQQRFTEHQQQQVVQQSGQVSNVPPQGAPRLGMSAAALAQAAVQGSLQSPTPQTSSGGQPQMRQPYAAEQSAPERTYGGQREQQIAASGMGNAPMNTTGNVAGPQQLSAVQAVGARPKGKAAEEMQKYGAAIDQQQRDGSGIPNAMVCPISLQPMERPVKASDGKVYDRTSIETWMGQSANPTSPWTREPLTAQLEPQDDLQKQIQSFLGSDDTVQSKLTTPQKAAVQKAVEQGTPRGHAVLRMLNARLPEGASMEKMLEEIRKPAPQAAKITIDPNAPRQPAQPVSGKAGALPQQAQQAVGNNMAFAPNAQPFGQPQFAANPQNTSNAQQYGTPEPSGAPFGQNSRTQAASPNATFASQGMPQQPVMQQNQAPQSLDAVQAVGQRQPGGRTAADQVMQYRQSAEVTSPNYQQPTSVPASQQQGPVQGKVDGWGIQRSFERDLGATANRQPVRPAAQRREDTNPFVQSGDPSYAQLEQKEEYTGRMVVKPSTQMRDMGTVYDLQWRQLSKAEQAAVKNLGWTQQVWDTKSSTHVVPAAYATPFARLTGTQKQSVRSFGFSAEEWDESAHRYQIARGDDDGSSTGGRGGQGGRGGRGGQQR